MDILGLILSISGLLAAAYSLLERIFTAKLFTLFLVFVPNLLRALFPSDAAITWFTIRSSRSLYNLWDVTLIYLFILPVVFGLSAGCWVFLALRLAGVFDIGTLWLSFWFALNWFTYSWSAVNQYALAVKGKNLAATPEMVKQYMVEHPGLTFKRWTYYFFRNWLGTPLIETALILTVGLFALLHLPAWLINAFPKIHLNLDNERTRSTYYLTYILVAGIPGLVLTFLAK